MEIILVGVVLLISKLVEMYCVTKQLPDVKCFIVGTIIMLLTFFIVYAIGFYFKENEIKPLDDLDIIIAFGVAVIVSLIVGFKCMLSKYE